MATGNLGRKLEQEVACSICLEPFLHPVLLDCGHNFCQACVAGWWEEFPGCTVCPQCPDAVQERSFRPNVKLAKVVEMIKELLRDSPQREACAGHSKPLKYFCAVEKALVCPDCVASKEHRGHRMVLLEDAADEYKDHFLSVVAILTNRKVEILMDKSEVETKAQHLSKETTKNILLKTLENLWEFLLLLKVKLVTKIKSENKVKAEKVRILAEFESLHQFLLEQEKLVLARVQEVEERLVDKKNEHVARVFREVTSVDSKVRVLETACQRPGNELLPDAARILERCGEHLKRLDAFPPEPEWRIPDLRDLNAHLTRLTSQFRDSLISLFQQQKENIPLNLAMVSPTKNPV